MAPKPVMGAWVVLAWAVGAGGGGGSSFVFTNECEYRVWPGVLPNAGWAVVGNGGFVLESGATVRLDIPPGWSGRFWGRTGCSFSSHSHPGGPSCATGDCSGRLECDGGGGQPPATLVEVTLAAPTASAPDFYDVSLVDGFNIPITISPRGGSGDCRAAGCAEDLNHRCPTLLQAFPNTTTRHVVGCKSACDAFGSPQFCCQGEYSTPTTCKPSPYSQAFKAICPLAYAYAYDDASSLFTCSQTLGYTIKFCPSSNSNSSWYQTKYTNMQSRHSMGVPMGQNLSFFQLGGWAMVACYYFLLVLRY